MLRIQNILGFPANSGVQTNFYSLNFVKIMLRLLISIKITFANCDLENYRKYDMIIAKGALMTTYCQIQLF